MSMTMRAIIRITGSLIQMNQYRKIATPWLAMTVKKRLAMTSFFATVSDSEGSKRGSQLHGKSADKNMNSC